MALRKGGSRSRPRRSDPGQLSLFETREQRAPPAKAAAASCPKPKRATALLIERPVLSPREAAAYLNVAVSTLKSWRAKQIGPAWSRRGARLICYFPADLDAFLRRGAQRRDNT
jgi:hypothetical protein